MKDGEKIKEQAEEISRLRRALKRSGECRVTMQGVIDGLRDKLERTYEGVRKIIEIVKEPD